MNGSRSEERGATKTSVVSRRRTLIGNSNIKRDVWWCSYGVNLGSEQDGTGGNFERLCVVVKKLSGTTFVALPLSTKEKLADFQVKVVVKDRVGYVLLDQVRVLDVKRMLRKVGYIDKTEFEIIRSRLKELL